MSEAKHTPGPLLAVRESEYVTNIETPDGCVVGLACGDDRDGPEDAAIAANARLWAAAPELLAAATDALELLERLYDGQSWGGVMDGLERAIAKARGGA